MARINDVKLRLEWRSRVIDHEGDIDGSGGIKRYLQLCETLKFDLDYVKSCEGILPEQSLQLMLMLILFRRNHCWKELHHH